MKICWDNLEKLRYSKRTKKWYSPQPYIYKESCQNCGEPYLTRDDKNSIFCGYSCSRKEKNNPFYGKKHSKETKTKISISKQGYTHSIISKQKISKAFRGKNHPKWKGGYYSNNIPLYDTYAHQIEYAEQVRRNKEDKNILEVKCTYCGKWYIPTVMNLYNRIQSLNGIKLGESRLYCSNSCKQECPIYKKSKYSSEESNSKQYSRKVQPELRQLVFERDDWTCQKCRSKKNLHCHHITGIEINPIESADVDNCVTLCKSCHKEVHSQEGCGYNDYRRKKCR
jgi:hypothetical protein